MPRSLLTYCTHLFLFTADTAIIGDDPCLIVTPVLVTPLQDVSKMCGVTRANALLYACIASIHIASAKHAINPSRVRA